MDGDVLRALVMLLLGKSCVMLGVVGLVIGCVIVALYVVWKRQGWMGLEAVGVLLLAGCTVGPARADETINSLVGGLASTMQSDLMGVVQTVAPYAIKVAIIVGGLLLVIGLIKLLANKLGS